MKILLWHGYLLTGSGSNVYTANIARSWRRRGHDVLLMCQEQHPEALDFLDEAGEVGAAASFRTVEGTAGAPGRCRLARPDIGRLLPVYVYDDYEGFEVKLFTSLTDDELAAYVERNVVALAAALDDFEPDAVITGHEVMGPYIARLACEPRGIRYLAKLHGSALEYAVKKQERYRRYAELGLSGAYRVAGGSRYMVSEASAHIPGWADRAVVVNPGCDVDLFTPQEKRTSTGTVGFVGKLIAAKGVQHLLAALPLVGPASRAVVVGYGGSAEVLHRMADALRMGNLGAARAIASEDGSMADVAAFFETAASDAYLGAATGIPVEFTGRLEHGPLSELLPTFDVLAVPSIVPEAFGMVAAEAAAAGVLPVVPGHSGIGEAGAAIEEAVGRPGLLTYDPGDPIRGLAAALERVLLLPERERAAMQRAAADLARRRWSWDRVADELLRHALG